jgi:hypothetical protein
MRAGEVHFFDEAFLQACGIMAQWEASVCELNEAA